MLASQDAAIAATKPGARFTDPHEATVKVLAQGMLDLGLLDSDQHGTLDDAIHHRHYFAHYMHRTGHWLGMDVHDCGSYVEPAEVGQVHERKDPLSGETIKDRPSRILRARHGADHRARAVRAPERQDVRRSSGTSASASRTTPS